MDRHRVAFKLLLAVALVLAGCTRDMFSGAGPAGSSAAAPTAAPGPSDGAAAKVHDTSGINDEEVWLGQPAAFSGASAGLGVEMWRGATAAFSAANAAGGVHGRKIRLALADDGYAPEKAAAAALHLIEDEKVFALFGGVGTPTITFVLPIVRKYYEQEGFFYFANFTGAQIQRNPPNEKVVFNVRASYYEETRAMVDIFVNAGRKRIATFIQDDAYGLDGRAGVEKALKDHGLEPVADQRYQRGQKFGVSNAAAVAALRAARADALVVVGSYQAAAGFVRDVRTTGWTVPIQNVSFVGADQMLALLVDAENASGQRIIFNLICTQVVPHYEDTANGLVQAYRKDVDKFAPSTPEGIGDGNYKPKQKFTFGSLEGYVSAKVFLAVLEKAGRDLNRKNFYAAAEGMGEIELGLGAPASFSPTHHQALEKVWFTYATPQGWRATDSPPCTFVRL
jgi:ABC-type branched-subunit amino acid transport system substrate-binding protein